MPYGLEMKKLITIRTAEFRLISLNESAKLTGMNLFLTTRKISGTE